MQPAVDWGSLMKIFELLLLPFAWWIFKTLNKVLSEATITKQSLIGVEGGNGKDGILWRIEKLEDAVHRLEIRQAERHGENIKHLDMP